MSVLSRIIEYYSSINSSLCLASSFWASSWHRPLNNKRFYLICSDICPKSTSIGFFKLALQSYNNVNSWLTSNFLYQLVTTWTTDLSKCFLLAHAWPEAVYWWDGSSFHALATPHPLSLVFLLGWHQRMSWDANCFSFLYL